MNTIFRSAILVGSVAALSACSIVQPEAWDAQGIDATAAKNAPDSGNAFQRSLHQGYADFGRWEFEQADFRDAKYFNDKARLAAAGKNVQPTSLSERHLGSPYAGELGDARARLMTVVGNPDTVTRVPGPAGTAQVYFDCWAEQAEEGHQPEHIEYCKKGFETAMGQATPAPAAQQAPRPIAPTTSARPYLVFFDWDKASLSESTAPTIDEIATTLKQNASAQITIAGHADKSGTNTYNDKLSQRRAQSVMNALAQKGVALARATLEFFGESRPLVDTADGVREPQNRRVEITVK